MTELLLVFVRKILSLWVVKFLRRSQQHKSFSKCHVLWVYSLECDRIIEGSHLLNKRTKMKKSYKVFFPLLFTRHRSKTAICSTKEALMVILLASKIRVAKKFLLKRSVFKTSQFLVILSKIFRIFIGLILSLIYWQPWYAFQS